jgi:hypothetical protein
VAELLLYWLEKGWVVKAVTALRKFSNHESRPSGRRRREPRHMSPEEPVLTR